MIRLTISVEGKKDSVYESDELVVTLGRGAGNSITLGDPEIGDRHCHIERTPEGTYKLVDLESSGGTEVNGTKVNVCVLEDRDRIHLGTSSVLFELGPDTAEMKTDRIRLVRVRRRGRLLRRRTTLPRRPAPEKVFTNEDLKTMLESLIDERGPEVLDDVRKIFDAAFEEHRGAPPTEVLEQERDNLLRMVEIAKLLASERNLKKLLEFIMDSVIEFTGAERGFLILREKDALAIRVARNFDREAVKKPEFKVSHSIAEEVIRNGKPVLSYDAMNDPNLPAAISVTEMKLRSLLCVPLRIRDQVIGCVYIDNRFESGVFIETDLPLLQGLADQAAIAIETANLLEENETRNRQLAASREEIERLNQQLREKVEKQYVELAKVKQDLLSSKKEIPLKHDFSTMIGRSRPMQEVLLLLDRVLDTDEPVFIHGESGTGKELVARAIHFNSKRAKSGKFVSENCSAIPDTLLESELFGHEKGAFTGATSQKPGLFELADKGTLFLDEIGDMSLDMQKKLLRAVQEGEIRRVGGKDVLQVDVRIISASNKDLSDLIKDGRFREDLFYRLNVVKITLPPLRERAEDIPLLVDFFLERIAKESGNAKKPVDEVAFWYLQKYAWPGNVRELENEMRRAVALSDDVIMVDSLKDEIRSMELFKSTIKIPSGSALKDVVRDAIADVERKVILKVLEETGWKKTEAAKALGISRPTLDAKIEAYRLERGAGKD